ncbi:uncharacterized protein EHS24_000622 [Apiotrichum porosum]|uniref:Small nuclear ribonucleoprotein Prp3 C-terminal domain-containing protein n=1 Tax=Apiotrichum porosum TaxID=105984 RepID=A0A427YAP4_9TREE|nr:uncharacterized protein EHS24_000622 [Apiotrichum porosum]RSH88095.1 hypothetical protein EHS24_000622 [Apiotrichum porosum]
MSHEEDALSALQLLAAMYPLDGELVLGDSAAAALAACEAGDEPVLSSPLELVVRIPIDDDAGPDVTRRVELTVSLLLDAPVKISVRQPPFLSRGAYADLAAALPIAPEHESASDTVMTAIETVRATASTLAVTEEPADPVPDVVVDDGALERVWFWFPSLSTREKRRDLVEYAATYRLTGFVLAGKPGLLCLEGGGKAVDRYMAAIKSESWGDIPSYQKKLVSSLPELTAQVTERLRRALLSSERKFKVMSEITHLIPQHGQYNHRGDMGEVKRLMEEWGVGDDFGAAVMNTS